LWINNNPLPIHPTAQIDPAADLDSTVSVGPFSIIGPRVKIGAGTEIGPGVFIEQDTEIGRECKIHHQASIGTAAQDLKYRGEPSAVRIGDGVIIRENVTVNRGTAARGCTRIGSHCALLAYAHVAHDCEVGDHVILANGVQLGGHVEVEPYATVGGLVPVHQFCRIGRHAFIGGGFRVVQDVPPFVLAAGEPLRMYGLNATGLRRAGFSEASRRQLKKAYALLYDRDRPLDQRLRELAAGEDEGGFIKQVLAFVSQSKRGIIPLCLDP
jgi:UDP-N-acetylglucosamine acyltransferase